MYVLVLQYTLFDKMKFYLTFILKNKTEYTTKLNLKHSYKLTVTIDQIL